MVTFVRGMQKDQQNMVSKRQKDFYHIKFYFNFILTETIFETNAALNINKICIHTFQIFLISDRQEMEFMSV